MDSISNLQSFNSQVPDSCSSLSQPSEPPDVGNWFSSYEYKTPAPDSNVNLEDEERERGEANFKKIRIRNQLVAGKKLVQSNTFFEEDKHEDRFLVKSVDSFSSHSLLSEPPDIRNWFSSYVYESFVPDTSSLYGDSATKERECEEEGFIIEEENEDEDRCEAIQPIGSVEHNSSSPKKNMKVKQPSSRGAEKILQPRLHETTLQHNISPTKYEETLSLNHASPECNQEATLMSVDINRRPPQLDDKEDIRETRSKAKIQHDKVETGVSLANRFSRDKENEGDMKSRNGFVSTRKNRCYHENSCKRSQEMLLEDSSNSGTVSLACERHAVVKRKALAEATNFQQSNAMEITGKWQCPQKGKPSIGPALKQLRLERWVHRA